jgi:hypothetical protein
VDFAQAFCRSKVTHNVEGLGDGLEFGKRQPVTKAKLLTKS